MHDYAGKWNEADPGVDLYT